MNNLENLDEFIKNQSLSIIFNELPSDNLDYKGNKWNEFEKKCELSPKCINELELSGFYVCKKYELIEPQELYAMALQLNNLQMDAITKYVEGVWSV